MTASSGQVSPQEWAPSWRELKDCAHNGPLGNSEYESEHIPSKLDVAGSSPVSRSQDPVLTSPEFTMSREAQDRGRVGHAGPATARPWLAEPDGAGTQVREHHTQTALGTRLTRLCAEREQA